MSETKNDGIPQITDEVVADFMKGFGSVPMTQEQEVEPEISSFVEKAIGSAPVRTTAEVGKEGQNAENTSTQTPNYSDEESGKQFQDELSYLRWKTGNDGRKWGGEKAQFLQRIEALSKKTEETVTRPVQTQTQAPDITKMPRAQIRDVVRKSLFEDDDKAWDPVADAFITFGEMMGNSWTSQSNQITERIASLEKRLEESSARQTAGVDPEIEQEILSKHPDLAALQPKARMAVLKDMAQVRKIVAQKPQAQTQARQAEEYVEGSARSIPAPSSGDFERDFSKRPLKDQLKIITEMARRQGGIPGLYGRENALP